MVFVLKLTIVQVQSVGLASYQSVSASRAKAELNALVETNKEAVHLVNLLRELDLEIQQPVNICVDNQACIALSKHSMNHGKTKNFALKVHFVRNLVES